MSWSCSQAITILLWHMPLLCVQWKTADDGQRNCPKHVELYDIYHCCVYSEKLLMMDRGTVRNMYNCMTYTTAVCTVKNCWWWTEELSETCTIVWHIPLLCVQWKTADDGQRNCTKHVEFYDIYHCCVQWKTPADGQSNCPKHVEFYSKNKFQKLVHLVGFIVKMYTMHGHLKLTNPT